MRRLVLLALVLIISATVFAQESDTILALRTDNTALETGQFYTIRIEIDDVRELWSATMTLTYDPERLYVVGTQSGSPLELGTMLADGAVIIQNRADDDTGRILFTPSRVNPADPVSGNGVLGTFLVVPLLAGETQLAFESADLSRVLFETNAEGQRVYGSSERIPFAVTVLTLSVTGDPATPPPEATATPTPTATFAPVVRGEETEAVAPTLAVVTDAPRTPTPTPSPDAATLAGDTRGSSSLLLIAIGLVVIGGGGLLALIILARRRS